MFHEPGQFAFAIAFEQNWRAIHEEYLGIRNEMTDWYERKLYKEGWKVFGLFDFPTGKPIEPNVRRCPFTTSLVQRQVRAHGAVGFSLLEPMTRIEPHQGYPGEFLRCHLALEVPPGDCALRVEGETHGWEVGKVLVFDDRVTHEAWNLTDRERVVLLFDFVPEP